VERILSLKETCRLQARSTYTVLVDAISNLFAGLPPVSPGSILGSLLVSLGIAYTG
jgi:hypothetical protein